MSKKDYKLMASEILELIGGKENVGSFTNCMTRLRVSVIDDKQVKFEELKELSYVIQLQVVAGVHQVVLGPGIVQKVASEFGILTGQNKDEQSGTGQQKTTIGQGFIKMMQAIMMPAIGGLMAVALIGAFLNILKMIGFDATTNDYTNALSIFSTIGLASISVLFALNTAKYFKGNIYLAVLFALFLVHPDMAKVTLAGNNLVAGMGGVIGVILMAVFLSYTERFLTKIIPNSLALLVVPLLTALITMVALLFVIIPVSGFLTAQLVNLFTIVLESNQVVFIIGSGLLGAAFPFLVLSGLHISLFAVLMPVYTETGQMPLIAAAFLGGAAQLGVATAVYLKERKSSKELNEIYSAGAPLAFMGVIEPIMYGINLPRVKPIVIASVASGIGGLLVGFFSLTMGYALPGLLGVLSFETPRSMFLYGAIWLGTVALGFVLCFLFYKKKTK